MRYRLPGKHARCRGVCYMKSEVYEALKILTFPLREHGQDSCGLQVKAS